MNDREILFVGMFFAWIEGEVSEGWLTEVAGVDRISLRAIRADAITAGVTFGNRLRPSAPSPGSDEATLRRACDELSAWRSPLAADFNIVAKQMSLKIAELARREAGR